MRENDSQACADDARTTENQDERERNAFNAAFSELELGWHWDEKTYSDLRAIESEDGRLRTYLTQQHRHLLTAYDADFLVDVIRQTKQRNAATAR
jgi:hypothetical protein